MRLALISLTVDCVGGDEEMPNVDAHADADADSHTDTADSGQPLVDEEGGDCGDFRAGVRVGSDYRQLPKRIAWMQRLLLARRKPRRDA